MDRDPLLLTAHPDGFCIRYLGEIVDVFPSFLGAATGMRSARAALRQLDDTLSERKDA